MRTNRIRRSLTTVFCAFALAAGAQDAPIVLLPFHEATVASALDSELKDYHYRIGEPFTNGAVIAELDEARYLVSYLRAREHRDFTARVAKEQRELRAKDFASEMELRKAEYEAKIAAADFAEAELNFRRCQFVAPFDGKISELLTQRYETVKPGQPLFKIIEDGRLLAVANLPLGSVTVGQTVDIVPDGRTSVTGTVYEVAPQADNRTGTVRVRVVVENADGKLTAGMTGILRVAVEERVSNTLEEVEQQIIPLQPAGAPYATVADAFQGTTPYVVVVSNEEERANLCTNRPSVWRECEIEVRSPTNGVFEIQALPSLSILEIGFQKGLIGYSLYRYPSCISLTSLKRIGDLTAGLYAPDGKRLAYIPPRQVSLPASGTTISNIVYFAPAEYDAARAAGCPLKLILRIDSDVRVLELPAEDKINGRD